MRVGLPSAACANATKFLSEDKRKVAFAAGCRRGKPVSAGSRMGKGMCQRLSDAALSVKRTSLSLYVIRQCVSVKVAVHPRLQRLLILIKEVSRALSLKM